MGALVNLAGIGCILVAGLAVSNLGGPANTGGNVGPPVFSDPLPALVPAPAPSPPPPRADVVVWHRSLVVSADSNGQFWTLGSANGAAFSFLVDTGASDVAFSKRDARRLGLDVNRLRFDGRTSTANGIARTASARIARLTVGPFTVADMPVSIIDGEVGEPLLGMAFLRRLNVAIDNGTLTLSGEP